MCTNCQQRHLIATSRLLLQIPCGLSEKWTQDFEIACRLDVKSVDSGVKDAIDCHGFRPGALRVRNQFHNTFVNQEISNKKYFKRKDLFFCCRSWFETRIPKRLSPPLKCPASHYALQKRASCRYHLYRRSVPQGL